jgi:hypothetical protein
MDSILISAGPILTVYKVDLLSSNTCRAAKTQNKCKIIKRHTHTHQSPHANNFFIGTAVINTHTQASAHRDACGRLTRSLRSCPTLRLPPAPSSLSTQFRTVENLSTVQPHKLRSCFAVLCVWKPERRSFTHSRSHARSLEVRFFRSQSQSSRPYIWGVGLTQQIA